MEMTLKEIGKNELLEYLCDGMKPDCTAHECEVLLYNFKQPLFTDGQELFVLADNEYLHIDMDDIIDAACDNCFNEISRIRECIVNNADANEFDGAVKGLNEYMTKRNEMALLDGLFEVTKYSSIIFMQAEQLKKTGCINAEVGRNSIL